MFYKRPRFLRAAYILKDMCNKHLEELISGREESRLQTVIVSRERRRDEAAVIPQKEVAMHIVPRCSVCDNEEPKIIYLRNPARGHYCGRGCLNQGRENFVRVRRTNAEAGTDTEAAS